MNRLVPLFWSIAAADAALLAAMFAMSLGARAGPNDGGREMGLFFFVLLPGVALALAMLLFHFGSSLPARSVALLIVVLPGLHGVKVLIENRVVDHRIEANRLGVGYFGTEPMRRMGAAVVARDIDTLLRLGPAVDVNAPGDDMTLLRLAVDGADARTSDGSELPVVRALLALGADADAAMPVACVRSDPALLALLLAAGADPNALTASGQPLVFDTISSIPPQSFRLLAAHGLDLDSRSRGDPLPVQLAIYRRWDLLAIALELGADMQATRSDGRHVASVLRAQVDEETEAGRAVPADLQRVSAMLEASRHPQ